MIFNYFLYFKKSLLKIIIVDQTYKKGKRVKNKANLK